MDEGLSFLLRATDESSSVTLIDARRSRASIFSKVSPFTAISEAVETPGLVTHNQVRSSSESLPAIGTCQDPVSDS